jgi:hypothetical protein
MSQSFPSPHSKTSISFSRSHTGQQVSGAIQSITFGVLGILLALASMWLTFLQLRRQAIIQSRINIMHDVEAIVTMPTATRTSIVENTSSLELTTPSSATVPSTTSGDTEGPC